MSLKSLSSEKRAKMSLIELTRLIMLEEKKEIKLKDVFNQAAELKGLSESARSGRISQFYTDLNLDGSFVTSGSNMWGLKSWYQEPKKEEDDDEDIAVIPRKIKRKRKQKTRDDDLASEFAMIDSHIDEISDEDFEEEEFEVDLDEEFDEDFDDDEDED